MKRSRIVGLALMGSAPVLLSACGEPPTEAITYSSLEQCLKDGKLSAEVCESEYQRAVQMHQQTAPRFTSQAACEAQYGPQGCQVVRAPGFGDYFMPAMAGFMVAKLLDQRRDRDQAYYGGYARGAGGYRGEPLYRNREDRSTWRTWDNQTVERGEGKTVMRDKAITQSRGGFGSQAAARGSWGS